MQLIIRALALLSFAVAAQAQNISIATGGTGGVYYPLGGGMAAMLSKYVPGIQATADRQAGEAEADARAALAEARAALTVADQAAKALDGLRNQVRLALTNAWS